MVRSERLKLLGITLPTIHNTFSRVDCNEHNINTIKRKNKYDTKTKKLSCGNVKVKIINNY